MLHLLYHNSGVALLSIPILFVLYWVGYAVYALFLHPLKDIPGPFWARFTNLWELSVVRSGNYTLANMQLHEKYGPIVRLAPNRYSIKDADAAKVLYGHGSKMPKPAWYWVFGLPTYRNVMSETNNELHSQKKRSIANYYTMSSLLGYERFVDNCNDLLTSWMEDLAKSGETFGIDRLMQFYAFDVIGEITFGERFGFLESRRDPMGIIEDFDARMKMILQFAFWPRVYRGFVALLQTLGIPFSDVVMTKAVEIVKERREGLKYVDPERRDFLTRLLEGEEHAGSDTTGISLTSALYYMMKNPRTLQKLREEIAEWTEKGELSERVKFAEAQKLPYLQAVIKEALRMHSAVGMALVREVTPGGVHIAGHYLPAGTIAGVNPWVAHFNTDAFGDDCYDFKPERWLTEDKAQLAHMESNFLAFGQGGRTCLGKNISMLEMTKVLPQIVRDFDLTLDDPSGEWSHTTFFFVKQDFKARIFKRQVAKA